MNLFRRIHPCGARALIAAFIVFIAPNVHAAGAIPSVIQKGLDLYQRGGAVVAFDTWQRGGALDGDNSVSAKLRGFKELAGVMGDYRSCDLIRDKDISQNSRIVYLAINFKRGAIYARFLTYRTESEWVVQDMTFSARPESIMPWLAFETEGGISSQ